MSEHADLYNSRRWRMRRVSQLKAHPLCKRCMDRGLVTAASVAHHIVPHRGDPVLFYTGALRSVCKQCHDSVEQSIEKTGSATEVGVDGWPKNLS